MWGVEAFWQEYQASHLGFAVSKQILAEFLRALNFYCLLTLSIWGQRMLIDGKSPDSRKIKTAPEMIFRGCLWLGYLGSNQD